MISYTENLIDLARNDDHRTGERARCNIDHGRIFFSYEINTLNFISMCLSFVIKIIFEGNFAYTQIIGWPLRSQSIKRKVSLNISHSSVSSRHIYFSLYFLFFNNFSNEIGKSTSSEIFFWSSHRFPASLRSVRDFIYFLNCSFTCCEHDDDLLVRVELLRGWLRPEKKIAINNEFWYEKWHIAMQISSRRANPRVYIFFPLVIVVYMLSSTWNRIDGERAHMDRAHDELECGRRGGEKKIISRRRKKKHTARWSRVWGEELDISSSIH